MQARILAEIAGSRGRKQIFLCHSGCVHLTYDSVTLNFPHITGLLDLAQAFRMRVLPQVGDDPTQKVELCYGRVRLWLNGAEVEEIASLLGDMEQMAMETPCYQIEDPFPLPGSSLFPGLPPIQPRTSDQFASGRNALSEG